MQAISEDHRAETGIVLPGQVAAPSLWGSFTPRPWQERAVLAAIGRISQSSCDPFVIGGPTGSGKSLEMIALMRHVVNGGGRAALYTNRRLLTNQMMGVLGSAGLKYGVRAADFDGHEDSSAPIQICSTQTEQSRVLNRRKRAIEEGMSVAQAEQKWPLEHVDLVLFDECFPGRTMVSTPGGMVRIDSLRAGDVVSCASGCGMVRATSRRLVYHLVELELSNGRVIRCTDNHRIFCNNGWSKAGDMERGVRLFSEQGLQFLRRSVSSDSVDIKNWDASVPCQASLGSSNMLLSILREEAEEPDAQPTGTSQVVGDQSVARSWSYSKGRQRLFDASSAANAFGSSREWMGGGVRCVDEREAWVLWLADVLQDRPGKQVVDARNRDRWSESLCYKEKGAGRQEDGLLGDVRVVRVSRVEFDRPVAVFNLHVSGHPSYFAEGVLVHNCHLQKSESVSALMAEHQERGAKVIGFTATPSGLSHLFSELVQAGTVSECIRHKALVPAHVYSCEELDTSKIKPQATGEYSLGEIVKKIWTPRIFGYVWEQWKRLNPDGRQTLGFAPGVDESVWFAEQFESPQKWEQQQAWLEAQRAFASEFSIANCEEFWKQGVRAAHIDGMEVWLDNKRYKTTPQARADILGEWKDGKIKVVWNRFVLREGIDCLDSQTEILTPTGWKGISDTIDECYAYDTSTGEAMVVPVTGVARRDVRSGEKMVRLVGQSVNIRVTDGHDMLVSSPHGARRTLSPWKKIKSADLTSSKGDVHFPISAEASHAGVSLSDDELRVVGWAMTDGWKSKTGMIEIYQSKPQYVPKIRELLLRLGWKFSESTRKPSGFKSNSPNYVFRIGVSYCRHLSPFIDKVNGSRLLTAITRRQFTVLWDAMMDANGGNRTSTKNGALSIGNERVADLMQELAVTRGFACSKSEYVSSTSGNPYWAVRIRDSKNLGWRRSDPRSSQVSFEEPQTGEQVWCVSNCLGTIITRRNGRVVIVGNSPSLYHIILACPIGSALSYVQVVGRAMRYSAETPDAVLITDHGGCVWRHGSPNEDRDWQRYWNLPVSAMTEDRMDGMRDGTVKEPITCPRCRAMRRSGSVCWKCGYEHTKSSKLVLQVGGQLKEYSGSSVKPLNVQKKADTQKKWDDMYFAAYNAHRKLSERVEKLRTECESNPHLKPVLESSQQILDKKIAKAQTFRQLRARFFLEHHYYPPSTLANMPHDSTDWYRKVRDVKRDEVRRHAEQ